MGKVFKCLTPYIWLPQGVNWVYGIAYLSLEENTMKNKHWDWDLVEFMKDVLEDELFNQMWGFDSIVTHEVEEILKNAQLDLLEGLKSKAIIKKDGNVCVPIEAIITEIDKIKKNEDEEDSSK